MSDLVIRSDNDGLCTLTLNRPDKMNALNVPLFEELRARVDEIAAETEAIGCVVLRGAGRAFSAGHDLKDIQPGEDKYFQSETVSALANLPQPVIVAVHGYCYTGALELALAGDLIITTASARFADTHARVGIVPGWGLSQKLPRLIGIARAKELSYTGNFIDAAQAERWGLVNRVVPVHELLPACRQLALDMLSCDPPSLRRYKQMIDRGYAGTFADGIALERQISREHLADVTSEAIAARRAGIQDRGRKQQS